MADRKRQAPTPRKGNVMPDDVKAAYWGVSIAGTILLGGLLLGAYLGTRPAPQRTFILQGSKIKCDATETACGMTLANCTDAPHVVLRCVTDLPEWINGD